MLSPAAPQVVTLPGAGDGPVHVTLKSFGGHALASFVTPLPIPKVSQPDPSTFVEKPDDQCSAEELYFKADKHERSTSRLKAREYYEKALARDPGYVPALRRLGILDVEAALYQSAATRLQKAIDRDPNDGLSWYFLGVSQLGLKNNKEALRCGHRATRCFGTTSLGWDLALRAAMRMKDRTTARDLWAELKPGGCGPTEPPERWLLVFYAVDSPDWISDFANSQYQREHSELVYGAIASLRDDRAMKGFVRDVRDSLGEQEFEMLETALVFADFGLFKEAAKILSAACVEGVPEAELRPLPLYYLAYFASQQGDAKKAQEYLQRAAKIDKDFVFPSRPEEVEILTFAVEKNPGDAHAHLHLGNLFANLGRVDEAVQEWEKCVALAPAKAMALRNLGLFAWAKGDLAKAEGLYRKAAAARPSDQTLFRDLAEVLLAAGKRPEAIRVMETMPVKGMRRAEITIALAQAYSDERRWDDAVKLLESTPYFVNWEGQDVTWRMFNRAHVERGRQFFDKKDYQAALKDFEAALTYPANLNVGRSNRPQEAQAQYFRGRALQALGRTDEARAAWKAGAAGAAGTGGRTGKRSGRGPQDQTDYRELCRKALEGMKG